MSIEGIKTVGLRSLGILFVLAGAALLTPSLGAIEKRLRTREQAVALHERLAACLRSHARPADCRRAALMENGMEALAETSRPTPGD